MRWRLRCWLILALTTWATALLAEDVRTYRCYTVTTPPRIDGVLDDEAWKALPASNSFRNLVGGEYSQKQTYIRLGWDNANLYIAVHCDEPDMKLVSARMGDGDSVWTEDSIEIFLQPDSGSSVFQFGVNSLGAKVGAERASGLTAFEARGHHGADFYSIEVKMPFALLGKTPRPGEVWRGNIDRNVWAGAKVYSCWSPLQGSFHDIANFGKFVFDGQAAPAGPAADASDLEYRDALVGRINDVVKKCQEYEPDLSRGLGLPAFKNEAQELQSQTDTFKKLQASVASAPLKDLAAGTRSCEDFFKRLHEFRYRVLIAGLFEEPAGTTAK